MTRAHFADQHVVAYIRKRTSRRVSLASPQRINSEQLITKHRLQQNLFSVIRAYNEGLVCIRNLRLCQQFWKTKNSGKRGRVFLLRWIYKAPPLLFLLYTPRTDRRCAYGTGVYRLADQHHCCKDRFKGEKWMQLRTVRKYKD